jgi:hypothetical protein
VRVAVSETIASPSMASVTGGTWEAKTYNGRVVGKPRLTNEPKLPRIAGALGIVGDLLFIYEGVKSVVRGDPPCGSAGPPFRQENSLTGSSPELSGHRFVREVLWEELPEGRSLISRLEEEERELSADLGTVGSPEGVGMYQLVSDVLVGRVFEDLFAGDELDEDLARRCATVIERLLGSGRPAVTEMVSLRITDHLLGYIDPWLRFKKFAGPLLKAEVDSRKRYYTGPF